MKDKYCFCALAFGHGRLKAGLVCVSQILLFPFQFLYVFGAWRLRNLPIPLGLLRADLQLPFFLSPALRTLKVWSLTQINYYCLYEQFRKNTSSSACLFVLAYERQGDM